MQARARRWDFFDNASTLPEIGGLALLSAQNLNNPQSIITPHAKAVPNVAPSNITSNAVRRTDKRKRANVVTRVGGLASLVGGYTSRAGHWADAVWWLLWIKNEAELAVWNAQRGSRRLTAGIITDVMTRVLEVGVRNGGIMPGGEVDQPMEGGHHRHGHGRRHDYGGRCYQGGHHRHHRQPGIQRHGLTRRDIYCG